MKPRFFPLFVSIAGLVGCGASDVWVDTTSGTCLESQIEEMKTRPELFVEMGTRTCTEAGLSGFAGDFRCAGSAEQGTLKLQAKCER